MYKGSQNFNQSSVIYLKFANILKTSFILVTGIELIWLLKLHRFSIQLKFIRFRNSKVFLTLPWLGYLENAAAGEGTSRQELYLKKYLEKCFDILNSYWPDYKQYKKCKKPFDRQCHHF